MSALHCLACEHENLRGEKFCQACGSTLDLKLCKQCEAVNEINAHACHKCGTPFASLRLPRARTAAIAAGACTILAVIGFAYQFVYRQPVAAASDVARQPALKPIPQPVATPVVEEKTASPAAPATAGAPRSAVTHTRP